MTNIFNMVGMYGDVVAVKILRNKTDCCLVQLAKPHHAQQVGVYEAFKYLSNIPAFNFRLGTSWTRPKWVEGSSACPTQELKPFSTIRYALQYAHRD